MRDENFVRNETAEDTVTDWYEVSAKNLDIYGLFAESDEILTRRIPLEVARTVNHGVEEQCGYGAGGRILFSTDSPFVALKVEYAVGYIPTVNNHCVSYGFDLYRFGADEKDVFVGAYRPVTGFDCCTAEFKVKTKNAKQMTFYTLNTPCFAEVRRLHIGIEKGSRLARGKKYRNKKPIVFYGSSITHGAAAGRPGNTYESFISQRYNLDYRNLGFSGNAFGEESMAKFIADLAMCAFVCDYDHNAPSVEHLMQTHYRFYEIIRKKQPQIPYIMISKPDYFTNPEKNDKRRNVILESYRKAKTAGDKNVYFIDGETLFEGEHCESCTSDGIHPNDLGFYRMSKKIGDVISQVLKIE